MLSFLCSPALTSVHDYWKNHSFDQMDLCLCFLIHYVYHSFPSKELASFNFMAAVTICSDFGAQENKVCHCFHCFPIYLLLSDGTAFYKESWAPKNWCFWTVVLEKTLESPLDCKEIQPVHTKGNQSWIFTRRTDAEAETPILWSPDVKNWFIWKDPDARKCWRREEKGMTEDEMVEWHHWLDGHEF